MSTDHIIAYLGFAAFMTVWVCVSLPRKFRRRR